MIKFFKKTNKKINISRKDFFMNPHSSWIRLIKIFLVVGIVLISFSLYLLFLIKNDNSFQVDTDVSNNPPSLINEDMLQKVKESINSKEQNNKNIESGDIRFIDPS